MCALVAPIANRTPVTILQHPRETRHAFGTVPLLTAALERIEVDAGLRPAPRPGVLLWPGDDATPIESAAAPDHLIAVDGTWSGARALLRDNPWIAALPKIALTPSSPGRYRTRREKTARGMATVEAVATALASFEPELAPGVEALFAAFEARERRWVGYQAEPVARMRKRPRPSRERDALRGDVVIGAALRVGDEEVAWAVRRGERTWVGRLDRPLLEARWRRCGLADAPVVTGAVARDALRAFVAGASGVFAWRVAPFARLELGAPTFDLKTIARRRGWADDPMPHDLTARLERSARVLERLVVADERGREPDEEDDDQEHPSGLRLLLEERERRAEEQPQHDLRDHPTGEADAEARDGAEPRDEQDEEPDPV